MVFVSDIKLMALPFMNVPKKGQLATMGISFWGFILS